MGPPGDPPASAGAPPPDSAGAPAAVDAGASLDDAGGDVVGAEPPAPVAPDVLAGGFCSEPDAAVEPGAPPPASVDPAPLPAVPAAVVADPAPVVDADVPAVEVWFFF